MFFNKSDLTHSFYSGNYTLQITDWEFILRSLITHSQAVWLRASVEFAPNIPSEIRHHLEITKNELISADLIRTWDLELTSTRNPSTQRVITVEEHKELDDIVTGEVNQVHSLEFKIDSIDRGAKNVDLQRDFWNLGLANYCGASTVILKSVGSNLSTSGRVHGLSNFNLSSEFARKFFDKLGINGLWRLDVKEILTFQESSRFYRAEMESLFANRINWNDRYIDKCVEELAGTYEEVSSKLLKKGSTKSFAFNTAEDIIANTLGIFFPIVSVAPLSRKFYDWVSKRNTVGFVLHMYELKKSLGNRGGS